MPEPAQPLHAATSIVPVLLSGGVGTRLWPLSRSLYPKQLQPLCGDQSMLVQTAHRVAGPGFAAPLVVCNHEHRFIVAEQLREASITPQAILLEPEGRNTAPAVAAAATWIAENAPDATLLVLPSDHLIADTDAFLDTVKRALPAVQNGRLATFAIPPTKPETGFGYIRQGDPIDGAPGCYSVAHFAEKPDAMTAERYLQSGDYAWNSGIFMFKATALLDEMQAHAPDVLPPVRAAVTQARQDMDFLRLEEVAFAKAPAISLDVALMERTDKACVTAMQSLWSDVGSWQALWEVGERDASGNVSLGDVVQLDSRECYLRSDGPLLAALGMSGIVAVATDDGVLIAPRERAQEVKDIVSELDRQGRTEHHLHRRVHRPWGWYQCVDGDPDFQVKRLMIRPGATLSLQRHHHRSEHWVVVCGQAHVTRGEETLVLDTNQSTYIPATMAHRLENRGDTPLFIIEVQTGSYLGEDDIERLEDLYGRD